MLDESLKNYIETSILPLYNDFDAAHQRDHVDMVVEQSMAIAQSLNVNEDMVYAIAAYHDTGLTADRKTHHMASGQIVREDAWLPDWFSADEIETIAQACEDHRASSDHEPRSIYGKIVAEADRFIDPDNIILRTVQYGLANYPELDKEGYDHRYGTALISEIIKDKPILRSKFDYLYEALTNPHLIGCGCPQCQPSKYKKLR